MKLLCGVAQLDHGDDGEDGEGERGGGGLEFPRGRTPGDSPPHGRDKDSTMAARDELMVKAVA